MKNHSSHSSGIIELSRYKPQVKTTSGHNDPGHFDVAKYLPPGIQVEFVEKGGSLFVPHRINEFSIKAIKRKIDLIVFQCMLRYTLGFQRPAARLSNSFIATWTGLESSNVRRGLRSLKQMGLITVLVPGSASTTTLYELPIVRGYLEWRRLKEVDATEMSSTVSNQGDQSDHTSRGKSISKKENINKTIKKAPSQNELLPHQLLLYIESVRPYQKRVEEEYHLQILRQDYPMDDIVEALNHVQIHGALDSAERVHSPLKYLSYTAEEVIQLIHRNKRKALIRQESISRKETVHAQQEEKND